MNLLICVIKAIYKTVINRFFNEEKLNSRIHTLKIKICKTFHQIVIITIYTFNKNILL